jgi:peptide/nickel transport system permease protein
MVRALIGRVLGGIVLVLVLSFLSFAVWATIPRTANINLALPEGWSEAEKAAALSQLGLDRPLHEQWGDYVWGLGTRGDFGETLSLRFRYPVRSVLMDALPQTIWLAVGGFTLALLLAVPLGLLSALRPGTLLDRGILFFAVVGVVMHPFVVGLILKYVLARRLGVAPEGEYCPLRGEAPFGEPLSVFGDYRMCGGFVDWLEHMWLPWLVFALFFLPIYTRIVRTRLVETLGEQYVLTARAKGASERRIVTRHVLRTGFPPLAAIIAVDAGTIIVAAIYIETIFGFRGIGRLVVDNLSGQYGYDRTVVVGIVVFAAIGITIFSLLADVTIRSLDPRVRSASRAF